MTPKGAEARDALLSRLSGTRWPYQPLLDALDLPTHLDVLDIGAGLGRGLGVLAWQGHTGRVVGLDPAPGPGVQFGEAEQLPFPAHSFDVALLVRVLAHLSDPARAVAEARRVLRPGGRLVLAAQGSEHLAQTWRALGRPVSGESGPDADLRDALRQTGHVATRLDVRLPLTIHAPDAEALVSSYGLRLSVNPTRFPVTDHLHLCVYVALKP